MRVVASQSRDAVVYASLPERKNKTPEEIRIAAFHVLVAPNRRFSGRVARDQADCGVLAVGLILELGWTLEAGKFRVSSRRIRGALGWSRTDVLC